MRPELLELLVLILTSFDAFQVIFAGCPRGWHNWQDSCYFPLTDQLNWSEASGVCKRSAGSGLVVPNSLEEHEFVKTLRGATFDGRLWIGCEIFNQEMRCRGVEKEEDVFANWQGSTPSDVSGKCIFAGGGGGAFWKLTACNDTRSAICEMTSLVPVYCASLGADGRLLSPRLLHDHVIKNMTVEGISECGQACWADLRCRSFNLWKEGPAKICQVNDATRLEASICDLSAHPGEGLYFDL